jgi:hypothetical protein
MQRSAIVLLTCSLAIAAGAAEAPHSFGQGVLAFEDKKWKEAESLMRKTIAGNPTEMNGTVSVSGSWFETYVPHYFLARALAKQGKCAEALKEFDETERQGVTPAIPDFAKHLATRDGCKPGAKPAAVPKKVPFETTVPFGGDEITPVTTTSAAPTSPPRNVVKPPPATKPVPPPNSSVETARLSSAIDAYLHGHYEETARLLSGTKFDAPTAAAQAVLFRAAARYAVYRIGGENDAGLRAQIDEDLRQYRSLRPNAHPDPRLFPPGFIAIAK